MSNDTPKDLNDIANAFKAFAEIDSAEKPAEKTSAPAQVAIKNEAVKEVTQTEPVAQVNKEQEKTKSSFFGRIRKGLSKTRSSFTSGMADLLVGKKEIDDEIFEELETQMLIADVGVDATTKIIDNLTQRAARKELLDTDALYAALQEQLTQLLDGAQSKKPITSDKQPLVIMVVGVNGVGKTTSIGKLAYHYKREGKKVMLAAGDTFRAAAVEQLQVWGERNDIVVVAQKTGSDSAAVAYDALQSAKSKNMDVLIVDTAGRLHNKSHLMDELEKVKRVLGKIDAETPHETWLVIDAGTGQNALRQVNDFNAAVGLSGLIVTKMDGTAKGGILFALAQKFDTPIRYIGVGEQIDDLQEFNAERFVDALFDNS